MNKALYYWRSLKWRFKFFLPEHRVTLKTENGVLSFSNKDWLIGKHLFIYRNYEIEFIESVVKFFEENSITYGKTICDVGANIGMIAIAFLLKGFFAEAMAFEPFPKSFEFLLENIKQNNLDGKVKCFQMALSSNDGITELEISEENSGDNRIRGVDDNGEMREERRKVIQVQKKSFDSLVEDGKISPESIDLIWLDIQGHEGYFFEGAKRFFKQRQVPVVCEFWVYGIRRSGMKVERYCEIIQDLFSDFWLYEKQEFVHHKISSLSKLFDRFSDRRQVAQIILL